MSFKKRKDPNGGKIIIQKNYNDECKWLNRNLIKEYNKGCNDKKNSDKFNDICQNIISENLKHKRYIIDIFRSLTKSNSQDFYKTWMKFIFTPYFFIGNKYMKNFNEYYDFLSSFHWVGDNNEEDELLLFRCMDNDEYLNFKNGGSTKSPSFSLIPEPISYLKCVSTLIDLEKTNVIVCCGFKFKDIISVLPTEEKEVLIRKGSKPTFIYKIIEFGKKDLVEQFGDDIFDYLPLKPTECFNGFGYMDSLIKKGYVYKKKHIMCGNQFRNIEESKFSKRYTENIDNIMREHICIKHKNIKTGWSPKIK